MTSFDERAGLARIAARLGVTGDGLTPPGRRAIHGRDVSLNVVDWGAPRPDAPTVLFAHGARLTARTWDGVSLLLRSEYHCIAVDLRGHGDSGWSGDVRYTLADHARDLAHLVEALDVRDLTLVGMSFGGIVSALWAEEHPAALRRLVLVDIGPRPDPPPQPRAHAGPALAERTTGARTFEEFLERTLAWNPRRDPDTLRYSLRHALRQDADGTWSWKWDPAHFGDWRRFSDDEVWARAHDIVCPTLVVRGGESDVLTPAGAAALMAALPDARLVTIEGAGHTVQSERPRELALALRGFLPVR